MTTLTTSVEAASRAPGHREREGFTLVELLTVIAIIAVLATLLLTALSSAQKSSRQARCTANLHQLSLALNMYLDDFNQRPRELPPLVSAKYLPSRPILLCPEDKTGNWGGLVNGGDGFLVALPPLIADAGGNRVAEPPSADEEPLRYSYLHPLAWADEAWNRLMKAGSLAGFAACQLHGLGKPDPMFPSIRDFEGLVLRAQRDGAVVRRKVFWGRSAPASSAGPPGAGPDIGTAFGDSGDQRALAADYPWPLFADESGF